MWDKGITWDKMKKSWIKRIKWKQRNKVGQKVQTGTKGRKWDTRNEVRQIE